METTLTAEPVTASIDQQPPKVSIRNMFPEFGMPSVPRRILAPTDFTAHSKPVMNYALALAERFHAALDLLHVTQGHVYSAEPFGMRTCVNLDANALASAQHILNRCKDDATELAPGLTVKKHLRLGEASEEIVEAARALHADLIVIGTHGRTGLSRLLRGSTAEYIVHHSPCPVLVVPNPSHD